MSFSHCSDDKPINDFFYTQSISCSLCLLSLFVFFFFVLLSGMLAVRAGGHVPPREELFRGCQKALGR